MRNKLKIPLILLFILLVASFFRLWQLNSIPPGLYPDVAMNGNDALNTLKTGNFQVFYQANNGREGLFMWLIALSFSIFGISIWSLKLVAAVAGILTVLGLYLLTKELFKKLAPEKSESIALLASFLLATSFWHTVFSRIGFRAILLPFVSVFAFYFLFRGFNGKKIWNFIVAGIFFGMGFYTYTSFRVAPAILVFLIIVYWFVFKKENLKKKYLISVFLFLLTIFLVALPLGIYFLKNTQDFISRAAPISVFAAPNPLRATAESLILHLGMFNFFGDPNWRHNFAGHPMLPPALSILFLIGMAYAAYRIYKSIKAKIFLTDANFIIFGFLFVWGFVMLLPGVLTFEGIPHALRTIGTIPPSYIFVALGGWWLYEKAKPFIKNRKLLIAVSLLVLALISFAQFYKYFWAWGKNPKVAEAYNVNYAYMGNYLNSLPDNVSKYVVVNEPGSPLYGISIPGQTLMFIEATKFGEPRANYITFENLDQVKTGANETVIVPLYDGIMQQEFQKRFPTGQIVQMADFWAYIIPSQ